MLVPTVLSVTGSPNVTPRFESAGFAAGADANVGFAGGVVGAIGAVVGFAGAFVGASAAVAGAAVDAAALVG
jgi:hypothetical protein